MSLAPTSEPRQSAKGERYVLIASVLIAGLCSIVYELLISTTVSYFLGDSIRQFSITIGLYMAAMGLGAFISRLFQQHLLTSFIWVEVTLGLLGGLSVPLLYLIYANTALIEPAMILLIISIGTLTGLEIPLLARILERHYQLRDNLANLLSFDYLGALLATLAFPFLLLPLLGVFKSSLLLGIINLGVGFLNLWFFHQALDISRRRVLWLACWSVVTLLSLLLLFSQTLLSSWSHSLYQDRIVYQQQTRYQKIVMTRYKDDLRLFLNGNLQFSSVDEYRYHEALVHVPLLANPQPQQVLVLGGGDGLAVRELLKYPSIHHITLVDLDPAMTQLGKTDARLTQLNQHSLSNDKVRILNTDAMQFLQHSSSQYDAIFIDLPDPNNISLARLYSREFYQLVRQHLAQHGVFVTQATSPYYAPRTFWSIVHTVQSAGFSSVIPYHAYVPSFGDWGFVAAGKTQFVIRPQKPGVITRFLDANTIADLLHFPKDRNGDALAEISTLDSPKVHTYYLKGWQYWH